MTSQVSAGCSLAWTSSEDSDASGFHQPKALPLKVSSIEANMTEKNDISPRISDA